MDFSKPRVAIYYYVVPNTGMRNDGPPLFLCANFRRVLNGVKSLKDLYKDMPNDGGNVVHLWPINEPQDFGEFNLHILPDHGEDAIGVPLDWELRHPSAYWVSDAHISPQSYEYRLNRAKQFDYVFCCQKVFLEQFERDGIPKERLFYLPHAVEPTAYFPHSIIEKWDWVFVGHLNSEKRVDFLDRLMKEFPNWYFGHRIATVPGWNVLEDAAKKYSQAKVVVNDAIREDLGMRVFEAMATKRALLTERVPDLDGLFKEGWHYEGWSTIDEAVEKMKRLLSDDAYRISLAEAGYKEVLAHHTYRNRVETILKTCLNYEVKEEEPCSVA